MIDEEIKEFDSAVKMSEFFVANNDLLKNNVKAAAHTALDANIAALYAVVRNMNETAKTIKKEEPDFENVFKLRRGTMSAPELLEAARGFSEALTAAVAAKFVEYGLSANLPANLTDKINAFEAARTQQKTGSGVAATAQTKATIRSLKQNRRTLKTMVANILAEHGDAGLIAKWQSASRIERAAPKKNEQPPTP